MFVHATKDAMRVVINMNHPILPVFDVPFKRVQKYKNDICNLKECKYQHPPVTWGQLLEKDLFHFCYLLVNHLDVDSEAFHALLMQLNFIDKVDVRVAKYQQCQDNDDDEADDVIIKHIQETYRKPYRST